jgi:putative phosphoesterase
MKYGIISDIHGNIYALEVALKVLEEAGVEKVLNLGDMIGYGANPTEVIAKLRDKEDHITIAGNHDRQVSGEKDPRMRKTAARALEWTQDNVSPNNARWLQSLPQGKMLDEHPIVIVHGSLCERDTYILTGAEIKRNLEVMINEFKDYKVCLFGHTHVPLLVSRKTLVTDLKETKTFQLDPNDQYLINPGSVGQPRDRCPLSAFGILDTEKWTMTFVRKEYDIPAAQKAIIDAGLPDKFSSRLAEGT